MDVEPTTTDLAIDIANVFADFNLTWKIGGSQKVPTSDDVQAVLDRAKYEVEYQQVNSHIKTPQVVMNHLSFKLGENGNVEVFIKIGEIK